MKIYNLVDDHLASMYDVEDFTRILENFPEPVCLFAMPNHTRPEQLLYVNQKTTELLHMTKEQLMSYSWKELFEIPLDKDIEELRSETQKIAFDLKESPLKKNLSGATLKVEPHPVRLGSGETVMVVTIINITEHYETRQQLKQSEQEFSSLFTYNPDIAFTIHMNGQIASINNNGLLALGYGPDEILQKNALELLVSEDLNWLREHFHEVLRGNTARFSAKVKRQDGVVLDVDITAIPIIIEEKISGLIGIAQDITEKRVLENLLKENEQYYRALFDYNINPVLTFDLEGRFLRINDAATRMINFAQEDLLGKSFLKVIPPDRRIEAYQNFQMVLDGQPRQYETIIIGHDQKQHQLHVMLIPVKIEGKLTAIHCLCKDITESRKNEDLANYMAYHDVLTSLGNQRLFQDELTLLTGEPHAEEEVSAVLLVDLDRFKFINDHLGHAAGDTVLQEAADRLLSVVGEKGAVFRYAGDEFTVILRKVSEATVKHVAELIVAELRRPLYLNGLETVLTASIGIGLYPKDAQDVKGIMNSSDLAMYHAKRIGRNNYQFYSHQIGETTKNTLQINSYLHKALEFNEFSLHYQPQYCARKENLCGFEALLRWECPQLGNVSPADFIPLAEENGLILPIGEWVLREACRTNKYWQEKFGMFVPVSVNLSLRQFYQQDLVEQVRQILEETELAPEYLTLEITESIAMQEEMAAHILYALRDLGVQIAMDDFGTGYSSFKQLRYFPIHHLKIDQAFIADLHEENGEAIVGAIISLGHNLRTKIVAEGVETSEQAHILKELGCDTMQGYYYARPQPDKQIEEMLADYQPNT
ncbi:EAL domain-containing protein [Chryseomicrobium palamuruense]|uniref:EAL domain-containing protein n=1 Tax=Chryseomicrobium palamuruense TaxID=682973 RepID=A0ABV8UW68_9BACL